MSKRWFTVCLASSWAIAIVAIMYIGFFIGGVFDSFDYRNSGFSALIDAVLFAFIFSPVAGFFLGVGALVLSGRAQHSKWAAVPPLVLNGLLISAGILFAIAMPNH